MKAGLRYQNGCMYEHHGTWYVRYRQRILQEDGSAKLNHASKHLGRSADFSNIFEVKRCRASFMQAVNRDRFSAHSLQLRFPGLNSATKSVCPAKLTFIRKDTTTSVHQGSLHSS